MLRNSKILLLLFCFVLSGTLWAAQGDLNTGINKTTDNTLMTNSQNDDAYFEDVIVPAKNSGQMTESMQDFLRSYYTRLNQNADNNGPVRDDRGGPDDFGYSWRDVDEALVDFDWIDIADNDNRLQPGDDWNSGALDMGWTFEFYGEEFDDLYICSNGWASFSNQSTNYQVRELPNNTAPENFLAPMWVDLNPSAGGAMYFFSDADEEIAVVSWVEVPYYGTNAAQTMQIVLTGDGAILYQYGDDNHQDGRVYSIGIQNGDRSDGLSIHYGADDVAVNEQAYGIKTMWIQFEDDPGILIDPDELDFGFVYVDNESVIEVEVTNVGAEDLVIDGLEIDNDAFTTPALDEEVVIESGQSITVEVTFLPTEEAEYEGTATVHSNAVNADEDGNTIVPLRGRGASVPLIEIDTDAIEEFLNTGETAEHTINVANDGGNELNFEIEIEVIAEPDAVGNDRGGNGPLRDVEGLFALFQDQAGWGFYNDFYIPLIDEIEFDNYNQAGAWGDVAFDDYDAIFVAGNQQSQNYYNAYNDNRDAVWDYVDGGGAMFLETGGSNVQTPVAGPGGVEWRYGPSSTGTLIVDQDPGADNYSLLAEMMGWDENIVFPGNSWTHNIYDEESFQDLDNSDWYQVLANGTQTGEPGAVAYTYGAGFVVVTGSPVGHQWRYHNDQQDWGTCAENILMYMLEMTGAKWITVEPTEGTLDPGGDMDIFVLLDAAGLFEGDYIADMHFLSNDPENDDIVVAVTLEVTGAPDIDVVWDEDNGYPDVVDFNTLWPDVFNGFDYEAVLSVENVGTAALEFEGIAIVGDDAAKFSGPEGLDALGPGEAVDITVVLRSDETGEWMADMVFTSNDPDEAEYPVSLRGETGSPPILDLSVQGIEEDLVTGENMEIAITVTNEGDAPLRFVIESEIISEPDRDADARNIRSTSGPINPRRDDPGDLLGSFQGFNNAGNYCSPAGWDWDNDRMWVTNYSTSTAAAFTHDNNYEEFEEQVRIGPRNCMDGAWLQGTYFTATLGQTVVMRFDENGDDIGNMQLNHNCYGLAADVEEDLLFLMESGNNNAIRVYEYADGELGDQLGAINNHLPHHNNIYNYPFDWVPGHPDGQLWMTSYNQQLVNQILVDVDEWTCVERVSGFNVGNINTGYDGVAHDGENMWVAGNGANDVRIYDDGIAEVRWLMVDPDFGELEGGQDMDVFVMLDATGLFGGDYEADLHFLSNDPEDEDVVVSVVMHVEGAEDIDVTWDEAFGYDPENPENSVLDWNLAYLDVFSGGPYEVSVNIANPGTELLTVFDIFSENAAFTAVFEDEIELEPRTDTDVTFIFEVAADEPGEYEATMIIESSDPDEGEFEVTLLAQAFLPPTIEVDPIGFEEEMNTGELFERTVTIDNLGEALLRWYAESEIISEPDDRDANARNIRSTSGPVVPRRDEPGDLIAEFGGNNGANVYMSPVGWDAENEEMYIVSYTQSNVRVWSHDNYEDFELVRALNTPNPMGGGFYEGVVYCYNLNNNQVLRRFDNEGNALQDQAMGYSCYGVAFDHEKGLMFARNQNAAGTIHIYEMDGNDRGEQIATLPNPQQHVGGNANCYNIEWVSAHPDGQMWVSSSTTQRIHQILVDTDEWEYVEEVQSFPNGGANQTWDGCAHDGEHIWIAGWQPANVRIYDDGVAELRWLTFAPEEGEVESESSMDMIVTLDAAGLFGGTYEADINIFSNDPANDMVTVSIVIEVTGAPDIVFEPEELEIDWNAAYADLFSGGPYMLPVVIGNDGTDLLIVFDIVTDHDYFTTDFDGDEIELEVGEEAIIEVTFEAPRDDPGDYNATLTVSSNDPDEDEVDIALHADAPLSPIIEFDRNAIESFLLTGQTEEFAINVSNAGEADLWFEIEADIISEPDRDARDRNIRSTSGAAGPRRDEVDLGGMMFAVIQDAAGWGWLDDWMMERDPLLDRDENYVTFRNAGAWDDIDFNDYNVIVYPSGRQSGNFTQAYNNNLERFEDYLDGGGCAYTESGDRNAPVRPPGGFVNNTEPGNSNGTLVCSPDPNDDNYSLFAEICHESQPDFWEEGERIEGSAWLHSSYPLAPFEEALDDGTISWYDHIAIPEGMQTGGAIAYGYGGGAIMMVGHPVGHCWNWFNQEGMWGSVASEILYYLVMNGAPQWLAWDPGEGVLETDQGMDIIVTLDATDLIGGNYEANLIFINNDPSNNAAEISILLEVEGAPVIEVSWPDNAVEAGINWNDHFVDLYFNGDYSIPVEISNTGTDLLIIESIECDIGEFRADPDELEVELRTTSIVDFVFHADAEGEYEGIMTIISNASNEEELTVTLNADAAAPPEMIIDPQAIDVEMNEGENREFVLELANDGGDALRWFTESEIISEPGDRDANARNIRSTSGPVAPRRDEPGDLIAEFNGPNQQNIYMSVVGWDEENEEMYFSNYNNSTVTVWTHNNYEDFEQVRQYNTLNPMDGGFYEGVAYHMNLNNNQVLRRFDNEGNALQDQAMGYSCYGVGFDKEEGLMFARNNNAGGVIHVYAMDGNDRGEQIATLPNPGQLAGGNNNLYNVEWVAAHPDGQMWISNNNGNAYQIAVDTDEWEYIGAVQNFRVGTTQPWDGIAHDGEHMWAAGWGAANVRIYDDGVAEVRWLVWEPQEGSIDPGGGEDVIVTLNAADLLGGEYEADLLFFSNDPREPDDLPDITVNILMTVIGQGRIRIEPGGPEEDNERPVEFGIVYIDYPVTLGLEIQNIGTDLLSVEEIASDNAEVFYVDPDVEFPIDIEIESSFMLPVLCDPIEAGRQEATLTFTTNDLNYEDGYDVLVAGDALDAPIIDIEPDNITDELNEGDSQEYALTVSNLGGSDLVFDTDFDMISEPGDEDERDNRGRNIRSTSSAAGPQRDPLPDDPPEGNFGLVQQGNIGWSNFNIETIFQSVDDLEYTRWNSWDEVDLDGIDAIWIVNFLGDQFNRDYNDNLEMIEDWVDGGGALYHCTGTNNGFFEVIHPGGLVPVNAHRTNTGLTVAEPEDCYMFELMEWEVGTRLTGNWFNHEAYRVADIEEIDNMGEYQVLVENDADQTPIVLRYSYGGGQCVVSGTTDGFLHNNPGTYIWGAAGGALIHYLGALSGSALISWEPREGTLEPDGDIDVIVTISTEGAMDGEYEGLLNFNSNDPETPIARIPVNITVIGSSWLTGVPIPEPLNDAETIEFMPTYINGRTVFPITLENLGSLSVDIEGTEITGDDADFFELIIDEDAVVPARDELEIGLAFIPENLGEHSARVILHTDAMNVEDGDVWWNVSGLGILGPSITVTDADGEELDMDNPIQVSLMLEDAPVEYIMTISNAEGEFRDDLYYDISFEEDEEDEGRDNNARNIRSTSGPVNPRRDDPGDLLGEFNGINQANGTYCSPAGYDWDNDRMWVSSYSQQISVAYTFNNDYDEFEEVLRINNGGSCMDGAWVNGVFFNNINGNATVNRWDEEGERLQAQQMNFTCFGMGADVENGWLIIENNAANQPLHVMEVDDDGVIGDEIGVIDNHHQFHMNQVVWNMEWVSCHPEGQLWMVTNSDGFVNQIFVDEDWEAQERVSRFAVNGNAQLQAHDGVAHDGENMWCAGWGPGNIRIYDDGVAEIRWIDWDQSDGVIPPGESDDITFIFDPTDLLDMTDYTGTLLIETNDPEREFVEIAVVLSIGIPDPEHFVPEPTNISHLLTVDCVLYDGDPVPFGWEIGAFNEDEVLGGGVVWLDRATEMLVYGAEGEIDGFNQGDNFIFMAYDPDVDEELSLSAENIEGDELLWANGAETSLDLLGVSVRALDMNWTDGWNLISINVRPGQEFYADDEDRGPDVELMFEDLADNDQIELMKDGIGRFWSIPWDYNSIPFWNVTEGYQVKTTGALEVTVSGAPIGAQEPVPMNGNWNMIAYFPTYELACTRQNEFYVISPIIDRVIIAKDVVGRFCNPEFNYSNMIPWREGQGYQVKIEGEDDLELIYPEPENEQASVYEKDTQERHFTAPAPTSTNMSVLVNNISGLKLADNDEIVARSTSGMIVGCGIIIEERCGLAIWGDEKSTEAKEGLSLNEAFTLVLWDADLEVERNLSPSVRYGNGLVYEINAFSVVDVTVETMIPENYYLSQNYPNPFNSKTRLSYGMPEAGNISISVFDVTGRMVTELVNSNIEAGNHTTVWDAQFASAGVYLVRMESSNFKAVRKIMLVK